jgi:hypothetical protein
MFISISINTYSITNHLPPQHSEELILPLQPKSPPSHKEKTETMAARKIKILFQNNTQQTLNWVDSGVEHGERSVVAPDQINPHDTGNWALESDGSMTGCEGWMTWRIGDNGPTVTLEYSNPYARENSYSCNVDSMPLLLTGTVGAMIGPKSGSL